MVDIKAILEDIGFNTDLYIASAHRWFIASRYFRVNRVLHLYIYICPIIYHIVCDYTIIIYDIYDGTYTHISGVLYLL